MPKPGEQHQVIEFLSNPETYGCAGTVERIDTHAAIVFLAGDRAYKLKRAIRLPYLDFSTVAKRRKVCESELTLNRRTAPDLYIEVRSIGRTSDGRIAFGQGRPVDWLVVMKRFPPDCLLDKMVRSGPLDSALTRQLAHAIVDFHGSAQIVRGGGARKVRDVIEGNRVSMAALPEGLMSKDKCNLLFHDSLATAERLARLLDDRSACGFVRHCHGDLHLGNICVWQGLPTLFDCLEFDPNLATIDLLYDLAFLLMDLWHRGHHSEASLIFNRYCDLRGENEGLAVLPLFLSMRAAVRAHVAGAAATRLEPGTARDAEIQVARGYLDAALALLEGATARLIAIGGLSGSGKSTLAASLAPLLGTPPGARWLRTDVFRKKLAGVEPEAHLPESAYTPAAHEAVYRVLLDEVSRTIAAGWPVIVDAVFDFPDTRNRIEAISDELGTPFTGLWLDASRHVLHERVRHRKGDASDAGPAIVDKQLRRDIGSLAGWSRVDAAHDAGQTFLGACAALGLTASLSASR